MLPKGKRKRLGRRRRNLRLIKTASSSSEIQELPGYQYNTQFNPATFPSILPANPSFNMVQPIAPTSVDVPFTPRTVGITGGSLRIEISNPLAQPVDDDVVYLYTVSAGQLVELVDLAEDTQNQERNSSNRSFIVVREPTSASEHETNQSPPNVHEEPNSDVAVVYPTDTKDSTEKPIVKTKASRKRKRSTGEARCVICDKNYEGITNAGGELFSSRCGHLFCVSCLESLDPYKCTKCNFKISNLWKIYL